MVPEGFIGIFENKGGRIVAVPHKCEVVQFRAVITAIPCTTTVSEHENQKQKFTSYPRKRVSLKSLKVKKTVSRDYRIHPCILPFGPARGCSNLLLQISPASAGMTSKWDSSGAEPFTESKYKQGKSNLSPSSCMIL